MTAYLLPTRDSKRYRGKYPDRINSLGYSRSASQQIVARYLNMTKPVHFSTNDGRRFIADMSQLNPEFSLGMSLDQLLLTRSIVSVHPVTYDLIVAEIRKIREQAA